MPHYLRNPLRRPPCSVRNVVLNWARGLASARSAGTRPPLGAPAPGTSAHLTRDLQNKKIAGVCAGFARYMDVDVVLVRVIWLALAFCTGIGFIAYVVAWIIMPKDRAPDAVPAGQYAHS